MFTKNIKVTAFSVLILGSSLFAMMLILGVSIAKASSSSSENVSTSIVENSYALCHDGLDNDNNGTTDMGDRNCNGFTTAPASVVDTTNDVVENSYALCHDGLDNDNNGTADMGDRNCNGFTTAPASVFDTTNTVIENSYALCHDGLDNDNNGTADMGDRSCSGLTASTVIAENSYALCHDGLDNDNNGTTDMGDRSCSGFTTTENSYALCHDGLDNDNNGTTDMGDRSCANYSEAPATTTATTTASTTPEVSSPVISTNSFSSSGSYLPGFGGAGSVLGAAIDTESTSSTSTCELFKTYMKKGNKYNNKTEVIKLQKFLNSQVNAKLPLTGTFGSLTEKAVKAFQVKNSKAILAPWVGAGRMNSAIATGYFFKTTQHEANKILCPGTIIPEPVLK